MHGSPGSADRLILRGYGPLVGLVALLLVLTMLVPSRSRSDDSALTAGQVPAAAATVAGPAAAPLGQSSPAAGPGATAGDAVASAGAAPAAPADAAAGPRSAQVAAPTAAGGSPSASTTSRPVRAATAPAGVRRAANCSGGAVQDKNTPYSPPCMTFAGPNGGATTRGVTADTITVTTRDVGNALGGDGGTELEKVAAKKGILSTPEEQRRTRNALLEYFNRTYQLYGRKVKLVEYKGRGSLFEELAGRGREEAHSDALKSAQEIGAFADLSVLTEPYMDALVRQKVMAFGGGIHLPASYYRKNAPYAWSMLVDCSTLVASAFDLVAKRMPPSENALRAGSAGLRTKPRAYGLLMPDDANYAACVDEARPALKAAGITIAKEIRYSAELPKMQQETPNMAAQFKAAGVSTVLMVTIDAALPFFMSGSATQQDYWPEWFVTGTNFTDTDIAGQFYDQDQWRYAAGQSYTGELREGRASESWRAFKAILPGREPTLTRDLDFYPMLMLFIGLQMAGPNLTPETFERGMFAYGPHPGGLGTWSFGPDDHTATDDAREIYYDPKAFSPFNHQQGRYIAPAGDRRYRPGTWPARARAVPVPPAAAA